MSDIDKTRAAHAALVAAKAACDAAGLRITVGSLRGAVDSADAVAVCAAKAAEKIASAERREVQIVFGDEVWVNSGLGERRMAVVRVGRTLVHLKRHNREVSYSIETGIANDGYGNDAIDADDLFRIKRDLVGKRPPKPAPVPQEIATVTKVKK